MQFSGNLLTLLAQCVAHFCTSVDFEEYQALSDMYYSNGGANWTWASSRLGPKWHFDIIANPCSDEYESWQGIKCSDDPTICARENCSITSLSLPGYNLTGQLLDSMGSLFQLTKLDLSNSLLIGSIPLGIGGLTALTELNLESNKLQFSIPSDIGLLRRLKKLTLSHNSLTGRIPSEITKLFQLSELYLTSNYLEGEIPLDLGNLQSMQTLYLDQNDLSGHIPHSIGSMQSMLVFAANQNSLSGPIPEEVESMQALESLEAFSNLLTGPFPLALTRLPNLQTILLFNNSLTGTIPSQVGNLLEMIELNLHDNSFEGALPVELGNCSGVQHLHLFNNRLTGSIPYEYGLLTAMVLIQIQGNELTGSIGNMLWQPERMALVNLDFSDNLFTGHIPANLFQLPSIQTIALSANCFSGTIPGEICAASQVVVLSMDGLAAGDGCRGSRKNQKKRFPYVVAMHTNTLDGSLPNCITQLPNITVAHFTGNGLTGRLKDIPSNSKLINLSFAHNHLSGTIPSRLKQAKGMLELDLSYNKLTGDTSDLLNSGSSFSDENRNIRLRLEVNRLSGVIPHIVSKAGKIRVLVGNLFACENVPHDDQNYYEYACGSKKLDRSLYAFVAVVLLLMVSGILYVTISSKNPFSLKSLAGIRSHIYSGASHFTSCLDVVTKLDDKYKNIKDFCELLMRLTRILTKMAVVGLVLCVPIYLLKLIDNGTPDGRYSTRMHMYNWLFSTAYITGRTPAGILLFAWGGVIYVLVTSLHAPSGGGSSQSSQLATAISKLVHPNHFNLAAVFAINGVIVFTANSFYVMTALDYIRVANGIEVIIQLGLATFKIIYSIVVFPGFKQSAMINILALLFNNIFVPIIVTGVTSESCYLVNLTS